jgi:hypothetical protein
MAVTGYAPLFFPGDTFTSTTSAAVTKGQLLYISGDNTVAPTTAATAAWVGVAAFDAASGAAVTVYTEGVHPLIASGSITAGDLVIPAASGQVATSGAVSATIDSQIVGKALAGATNGNPVNVILP